MKTIDKDSRYGGSEVHDDTQMYKVLIDNDTKKVIEYSSELDHQITLKEIQEMVDNLMSMEMLSLIGESTTDVDINIWEIEHTAGLLEDPQELFIETYHEPNKYRHHEANSTLEWDCYLADFL